LAGLSKNSSKMLTLACEENSSFNIAQPNYNL
jgi:hypothetical protein